MVGCEVTDESVAVCGECIVSRWVPGRVFVVIVWAICCGAYSLERKR